MRFLLREKKKKELLESLIYFKLGASFSIPPCDPTQLITYILFFFKLEDFKSFKLNDI